MHPIIPKPGIALNPTLLRQNIIILPLQITRNLAKARLVIHAIAKPRRVHNRETDARPFLVQFELDGDWLDFDVGLARRLAVEVGRGVGVEVREHGFLAQSVDEGGAACARGAADHETELDALFDVLLAAELGAGDAVGGHCGAVSLMCCDGELAVRGLEGLNCSEAAGMDVSAFCSECLVGVGLVFVCNG